MKNRIKFPNTSVQCFINASLQLVDDLEKDLNAFCDDDKRDKWGRECRKDVTDALKTLYNDRNIKNRNFFLERYFHNQQEDSQEFLSKILEAGSPLFSNVLHEVRESRVNCVGFAPERPPQFFLNLNSLGSSFKEIIHKDFDILIQLKNTDCFKIETIVPRKDLIIHLSRFNNYGEKIRTKVVPDPVLKFPTGDYELRGCIVHHGKTINNGHYTYFVFGDDGKPNLIVNDNRLEEGKGRNDYLFDGYVFLYKKKGLKRKVDRSKKKKSKMKRRSKKKSKKKKL